MRCLAFWWRRLRAWAERNRRAYSTEVEITMEPYLEREEALQARQGLQVSSYWPSSATDDEGKEAAGAPYLQVQRPGLIRRTFPTD